MCRSVRITVFIMLLQQLVFPSLGRDGKYIVDSQGERILLRGIGLGGWLVPEGYMLNFPRHGSASNIRAEILDLLGPEDTDEFYRRYDQNYVNEKDIEQIKEWGFNSVRLPMHWNRLIDPEATEPFIEKGFAEIDSLLAWCERRELHLILDLHAAPGGQNGGDISDAPIPGVAQLWTDAQFQATTVDLWREIQQNK